MKSETSLPKEMKLHFLESALLGIDQLMSLPEQEGGIGYRIGEFTISTTETPGLFQVTVDTNAPSVAS